MLQLKNIIKNYKIDDREILVLKDISLTLRKSELVAILGPSGCGKTTMLNIIGGLDKYTSGDLFINGKSTKNFDDRDWDTYRNHSIGFVFQSYNLIQHLNILSNVEMALTLAGISKEQRKEKARIALEKVGLSDQITKKPNQLSGGQMQRVAIARALVNDPDIILADEPTGALDSETGLQVMDILKEVARERLVIMVTHNGELAKKYATRTINMFDGKTLDDTNPLSEEEVRFAEDEIAKVEQDMKTIKETGKKPKREKRIAMSIFTAFNLSLKNLWSKKGRTFMTSFAGSIGIFGIALILAISSGMSSYIQSMQTDSMSQMPITVEALTLKSDAMQSMQESMMGKGPELEEFPSDTTGLKPYKPLSPMEMYKQNDITQEYIDYINNLDNSLVSTIQMRRSIEMHLLSKNSNTYKMITFGNEMQTKTDKSTLYAKEMTSNTADITRSYDILAGGKFPNETNELALVVDKYNRLSTDVLSSLNIDFELDKEISYESLIGKEFKLIFNNDYYIQSGNRFLAQSSDNYANLYSSENSFTLKIASVLRVKPDTNVAWLNEGIVYTPALTDMVLEDSLSSTVAVAQRGNTSSDIVSGAPLLTDAQHKLAMQKLGATALPSAISIYPKDFSSKEKIVEYLDAWNVGKEEVDQIGYTDMASMMLAMMDQMVNIFTYVLIAFSAVSLVVSSIMIAINTYASVIERTKEIGVLRSLGARKKDISRIFNAETMIIGFCAGFIGVIFTLLASIPVNAIIKNLSGIGGIASLNFVTALIMIGISMLLTLIAGLIPSRIASKKDPVTALRTE